MKLTEEELNAIDDRFIAAVGELKMRFPVAELSEAFAYSSGTISEYLNRNKHVSKKFLRGFCEKYSLDFDLIYKGQKPQGEEAPAIIPFKSDAFDLGAYNLHDPRESYRGKEFIDLGNGKYLLYTPLVPHIASMGYLSSYADPTWLEELPQHAITVDYIPRGMYRTFIARGDSMNDGTMRSLMTDDKITGRVIEKHHWVNKLHLHKYKLYVIVHMEGITIKEITDHDVKNGTITIHSWNPDKKEYPDRVLHLKDVLQLLNVIKIERDV